MSTYGNEPRPYIRLVAFSVEQAATDGEKRSKFTPEGDVYLNPDQIVSVRRTEPRTPTGPGLRATASEREIDAEREWTRIRMSNGDQYVLAQPCERTVRLLTSGRSDA